MAVQKPSDALPPPPPYSSLSKDQIITVYSSASSNIELNTSGCDMTTTQEELNTQLIELLAPPGRLWWLRACYSIAYNFLYLRVCLLLAPLARIAEFDYLLSNEQCPGRKLELCLLLSIIPLCVSTFSQTSAYKWFTVASCFLVSILVERAPEFTTGSILIPIVHFHIANCLRPIQSSLTRYPTTLCNNNSIRS